MELRGTVDLGVMASFVPSGRRDAANATNAVRTPRFTVVGALGSVLARYDRCMATLETVAKLALALPEVVEQRSKEGLLAWSVKGKSIAWERPLRRSDLLALGDKAPKGTILAVYVPDLETKDAMLTAREQVYFTTPHFDGYAIVLIRLAKIPVRELREALSEAWRARAPKRLLR